MASADFLKFLRILWMVFVPFVDIRHRYDAIIGFDIQSVLTFTFCVAMHCVRAMPIVACLYKMAEIAARREEFEDDPSSNQDRLDFKGVHLRVFTLIVYLITDMFAKIPAFHQVNAPYLSVLGTFLGCVILTVLLYYTTAPFWRTKRLTLNESKEQKA